MYNNNKNFENFWIRFLIFLWIHSCINENSVIIHWHWCQCKVRWSFVVCKAFLALHSRWGLILKRNAPFSCFGIIHVSRGPEIPNCFEKTLFTPLTLGQASAPTSDEAHANTNSLAAAGKSFVFKKGVNYVLYINVGSRGLQRLGLYWTSFMEHFFTILGDF